MLGFVPAESVPDIARHWIFPRWSTCVIIFIIISDTKQANTPFTFARRILQAMGGKQLEKHVKTGWHWFSWNHSGWQIHSGAVYCLGNCACSQHANRRRNLWRVSANSFDTAINQAEELAWVSPFMSHAIPVRFTGSWPCRRSYRQGSWKKKHWYSLIRNGSRGMFWWNHWLK